MDEFHMEITVKTTLSKRLSCLHWSEKKKRKTTKKEKRNSVVLANSISVLKNIMNSNK